MKRLTVIAVFATAFLITSNTPVQAQCPLAHTHIGKNPTWRPADWGPPPSGAVDPDDTDDSQLWFYSLPPIHSAATPGWPNWGDPAEDPFLLLVPETDPMGDPIYKPEDPTRKMYTCRFMYSDENGYGDPEGTPHLDGWHSAHGPQGAWNLESVDEFTPPDWDIYLQREVASVAEDNFFMLMPSGAPVLTTNGSTHQLPRMWLEDFEAWGIHEHMSFNFWLASDGSDEDSTVTCSFSAFDGGSLYTPSDVFEFRFNVVPEPATLGLLAFGVLGVAARRNRRGA